MHAPVAPAASASPTLPSQSGARLLVAAQPSAAPSRPIPTTAKPSRPRLALRIHQPRAMTIMAPVTTVIGFMGFIVRLAEAAVQHRRTRSERGIATLADSRGG